MLALAALFALAAPTPPPTPPPLGSPAPIASPSQPPSETPSPPATETPVPAPAPTPTPAPTETPQGPRLTVSATQVNLNPAGQRTISISGASPPLVATLDRKLVGVAIDPSGIALTLTATQATGSDVLHLVDANGARADVGVRVAFNAGTIVPQTTLKVTGSPVDPAWLVNQVKGWVSRLTLALPGTQTTIGDAVTPVAPLAPGAQTQFTVPVQILGNGTSFDQIGSTVVDVQNVPLDPFAPPLLFYDDDPEHLTQDGVVFRGTIAAAQPVRLYYYHDDAADPRRLAILLTSSSQDPTSMQLIDASAGPNIDVMQVGHAVSRGFLSLKRSNEGVIVDLPQDQPYVLHDVPMNARQGVAGTLDVRVLSGGPVTLAVVAVSPGADPRTFLAAAPLPDDGHHRTGVFAIAGFGNEALAYTAGADNAKVVIGDRDPTPPAAQQPPQQNDPPAGHDYGDYGVLHTIDVTLNNPSPQPATAYLYFRPIAGIARGSFLVDGAPVELGCVRVPVPYQLWTYTIPAGGSVRSSVATMTDGGSFYPIEIGVSGAPPQPSAPPITAPDGCFPRPQPSAVPSPAPTATPPD